MDFEETVGNIRAETVHEVYGHGLKKWGDETFNHHKCYMASIDSRYWEDTSPRFRTHTVNKMYDYVLTETKSNYLPYRYFVEFWKYQTRFK
jgi:hypothetical protein